MSPSITTWICGALVATSVAACGAKIPQTRYYALSPAEGPRGRADLVLALEPLETDAGYDDERIVYRSTPYRLDYYQYHRWSAAPGVMIGNYLEQALERSGRFREVVREISTQSTTVLGGRVVAIEEIDRSKTAWVGRIVVELHLSDTRTGETVWTQQFEEEEPLPTQSPEGLARALSTALGRIAAEAAPTIAELSLRQRDTPAAGSPTAQRTAD